jgi:hypothetical protein
VIGAGPDCIPPDGLNRAGGNLGFALPRQIALGLGLGLSAGDCHLLGWDRSRPISALNTASI